MIEEISALRGQFLEELNQVSHLKEVEDLKVRYLGKKGPIQALLINLKNASSSDRPLLGKMLNDLKAELEGHCEHTLRRLADEELRLRLQKEALDPTLPGRRPSIGRAHPVMHLLSEALDILSDMGFSIRLGPNLDTDYYNFEALNFPPGHPARAMQDTFYFSSDLLLRTHTSNVQAHILEEFAPPLRIVAPGRCFRNETISSRSHVFFHQIEGFVVDEGISFADLLTTMEQFWARLLGPHTKTRFRPSYFPFVEPGLEVDVACTACQGSGCRLCKESGYLEVCGAGMIHPTVLSKGGLDAERFTGFAWGMGIERLTMLRHGITDIRLFTESDDRFLRQFSALQ